MRYLLLILMLASGSAFAQEPVPEDFDPDQGDGNTQENVLGGNYNGSHVQGGTFVQGDSFHNSSTRIQNPTQYNGYVATIPLVASPGSCMGSSGSAVSMGGFGYTKNKTLADEECNRRANETLRQNNMRANVEMLRQVGMEPAALALLCMNDEAIRASFRQVMNDDNYFRICGTTEEKAQHAYRVAYEAELEERDQYEDLVISLKEVNYED